MASNDNLTAVLYGINDIRLEQRPIPVPKDDQVLLQMAVVGICGSDVHYLVHGSIGPFVVKKPMIIGHEASGTVVKVGKNVKHLQPGDQVAIEPGVPCRFCAFCKSGDYHLCADIFFCATPPDDGNLSRYYVHAADFCHKGFVTVGDVVLILGAGPIGLVTLLSAKAMGASKIIVTDIWDVKLQTAKELGAHHVIKIEKGMEEDAIVAKIVELLGEQPNKTFDCSGAEQSVRIALKVTKSKGIVVLIGMGQLEQTLPLSSAIIREVDIRGVFRYSNDYPIAIDMVASGKISVKPLITHHFKIEETVKAFEVARTQAGNPIKILIHANPNWKPNKK
ncbi:hypothetical protein YQE_03869, partial [Dendroctonus ponderosae]